MTKALTFHAGAIALARYEAMTEALLERPTTGRSAGAEAGQARGEVETVANAVGPLHGLGVRHSINRTLVVPSAWHSRSAVRPSASRSGCGFWAVLFFSLCAIFSALIGLLVRLSESSDGIAMKTPPPHGLSRRERQIVDILYTHGQATAAEVRAALPDPPSYSAVRAMLRILEEKGHIRHEQVGPRYVYLPTVARDRAKRSALRHVLQTFFEGSAEQAISALLDDDAGRLSESELNRLARMIQQARRNGA